MDGFDNPATHFHVVDVASVGPFVVREYSANILRVMYLIYLRRTCLRTMGMPT